MQFKLFPGMQIWFLSWWIGRDSSSGLDTGGALSQLRGVPGASGGMQGRRQMPSAASIQGPRVALPCSFYFRRTHILVLLANPWGHSMASQVPLHTCERAPSWATGNGSTGVRRVIQAEGHDSHTGFQCCLRCPRLFEMPLSLRHSPGPRE